MRFTITLLIILLSSTGFGQKFSDSTNSIVNRIVEHDYFTNVPHGVFGMNTKTQTQLLKDLEEKVSSEELVRLTNHKNKYVRVYAVQALDLIDYPQLLDVVLEHIDDLETFTPEAVIVKKYIGDQFVNMNLSDEDRKTLDSILLYTKNKLSYTNYMIEDLEPNPVNYDRIRQLAKENECAMIAIAKYQKQEDIEFIQKKLLTLKSHAIYAIEEFPDPRFKATITEIRDKNYDYYENTYASAAYKDDFSVNYLRAKLNSPSSNDYMKKQRAKTIFSAISKYHDSVYNDLYFELWEQFNIIRDTTFSYLCEVDATRSLEIALKSASDVKDLNNSDLVLVDMLNYIVTQDEQRASELLQDRIINQSVHKFNYFAEACERIQNEQLTKALLLRLSLENNAHCYIPIANSLLSYEDETINTQLLQTLASNKNISDWGKERLIKSLKKYNLTFPE